MKAKGQSTSKPKPPAVTKPAARKQMSQFMNAAVVRGTKAKESKRKS